jgi:hypothetical protein
MSPNWSSNIKGGDLSHEHLIHGVEVAGLGGELFEKNGTGVVDVEGSVIAIVGSSE